MAERETVVIELVPAEDACPSCGEADPDRLVWVDDGEAVECQTCATRYRPPALS
jgi:hypothetical protein